jgi:hypothetical protein
MHGWLDNIKRSHSKLENQINLFFHAMKRWKFKLKVGDKHQQELHLFALLTQHDTPVSKDVHFLCAGHLLSWAWKYWCTIYSWKGRNIERYWFLQLCAWLSLSWWNYTCMPIVIKGEDFLRYKIVSFLLVSFFLCWWKLI